MRRVGFHVLTLALVLGVLEAMSWIVFATALGGKQLRYRDLDALGPVPTQAEMDTWRMWGWDRELGWVRRPNTQETVNDPSGSWTVSTDERGARREPFTAAGGLVSAYGDSFTFGHEVNDDQTWPHDLSERLGTRVDNWGQSAWGPDQAVLRLQRNLPKERTAIVVLVVMSENIARLLNCYRPFLDGNLAMKMAFKPMLAFDGDTLTWLPNPLARADTSTDWLTAVATARQTDTWYLENHERIRPRFPYLFRLPEALAYAVRHPTRPNLYEQPGAVARLDYVLAEFQRLAGAYDFVPVVLFVPEPADLERFTKGQITRYHDYVAALRARTAATTLIVLDLVEHPFDAARFNRRPFTDHPSPYGQHIIADVVRAGIVDLPALRPLATASKVGDRTP